MERLIVRDRVTFAISGYNGSGLDCDWVPAPNESTGK